MSGLTSVSDVNDSSDKSKINVSFLPFIFLLRISFVLTLNLMATVNADKLKYSFQLYILLLFNLSRVIVIIQMM